MKILRRRTGDLLNVFRATRSAETQNDLLWFTNENQHLESVFFMLANEAFVWSMMDNNQREQARPFFEASRQTIESDLALMLPLAETNANPTLPPPSAYVTQTALAVEDYRKILDLVKTFRFRMNDEHLGSQR